MKNKLIFKVLLTTTLIKTSCAKAEVDLSEGSFIFTSHTSPMSMIYNSRSVHQGLLGFGWCSPFEDSLDPIKKTILKLRDCRAGKVIAFQLSPTLRSPSSNTKIFVSGNQKITSDDNHFILSGDGGVRTFDKNGKLLEIKDERGKLAKLIYDKNGYLKEIISGRKDSLKLTVDPRTGRVVEVIDPQGARTRLTFLKNNLISAAGKTSSQFFKYDEVANLREISEGNKTTLLTYDSSDRVTSVKVAEDCSETYSYSSPQTLVSQTEVKTNCRGINNKRLVDFFYSKNSAGDLILDNVLSKTMQLRSSRLPANQKSELH